MLFINMRTIKFLPFFFLIFLSCESTPSLVSFFVRDGVIQYFLSPTNWNASGSKAKLDITYRTGEDTPAIVNISFYDTRTTPRSVNADSVSLCGAGVDCPLVYDFIIFADPEKNELRVSFTADRNRLVELLEAEPITLTAEVDGTVYVYTPEMYFNDLKNKFLIANSILM